jgi:hypothetical protein
MVPGTRIQVPHLRQALLSVQLAQQRQGHITRHLPAAITPIRPATKSTETGRFDAIDTRIDILHGPRQQRRRILDLNN